MAPAALCHRHKHFISDCYGNQRDSCAFTQRARDRSPAFTSGVVAMVTRETAVCLHKGLETGLLFSLQAFTLDLIDNCLNQVCRFI